MRRYQGPGKFEGCLLVDLLAYSLSTDSSEFHSREGWGDSASFVEGPFDYSSTSEAIGDPIDFDEEELTFLRQQAAAIVYESSDGFVSVDWFPTLDEARKHFDEIAVSYAGEDEDAGD